MAANWRRAGRLGDGPAISGDVANSPIGWACAGEQREGSAPVMTEDSQPPKLGRLAAVDAARGAALIGMAGYHLSWDLAYFGLISPTLPTSPPMRLYSHLVAATFLTLVGVSLVLAHRGGFRRRAFQRRLLLICAAALLVTGATHLLSPENTIYFGILHCIALASLLAAPLLPAPLAFVFAASALVLAAPFLFANAAFNPAPIVWLGLGTTLPDTLDWRPLLPWSGFVFLGLGLTRLAWRSLAASRVWRWRPKSKFSRAIAWTGRHTLAIYLVHQPALFAVLYVATGFGIGEAERVRERFRAACIQACEAGGGSEGHCRPSCQCVIDGLTEAKLTIAFTREDLDPASHAKFSEVIRQCAGRSAP